MAKYVFAMPELPGKDARSLAAYCRANLDAYRASRRRAGITMERAYLMPSPMGNFAIAYFEAANDFATTLAGFIKGDAFDKGFLDRARDVHGFDPSKPPPAPEVVGEWSDPAVTERRAGLAFTAPLKPGKVEAGRAFAKAAFETRRDQMTDSRRALGQNREVVCVNFTPNGEIVSVYLEGYDPAEGNRNFAASKSPFDTWFKAECRKIFVDGIDFDQPVPRIEQLWDWQSTKA